MPFVTAPDGTRLAYAEVGQGPPLICLPGGPGRASAYLEDLGGLSAHRTLVRLDLRATGHSEVPADPATLRFDRLADDVEALRGHLGLTTVDVLGHSAGCIVAQAWAAQHPDRVGRLLLLTPSDLLQGGRREDTAAIRAGFADEDWYADAAEALAALDGAAPAQAQALVRATRPFMYGRWDARTQEHAAGADRQSSRRAELGFRGGADGADGPDPAALLADLRCVTAPVLVVGAERDTLTGLASVGRVAACFPAAQTTVVPRAGHFPWVDEPAGLLAAVTPFLAGA